MDELNNLVDEILNEVLKDTENIMWKLARTTHIPGYEADDLMQEMRIKIWQTIEKNHYDPELCKPTSFYYRVCKNHLINLNKSTISRYASTKAEDRVHKDALNEKLDQKEQDLTQFGEIPTSFVQNFTDSFINEYFKD